MNGLYFMEINKNIEQNIYFKLLNCIDPNKRQKIEAFSIDIDKKLSLYSDILVRYLLCKNLKRLNKDLKFYLNDYGKPYLLNFPEFQFNISHTHNAIAVGVSEQEIGVDIEKVKQVEMKVAKRFFTNNELQFILDNKNQNFAFYQIWTKKEAYIKFLGKGLAIPLDSFDILSDELNYKVKTMQINDYIISVCSEKCSLDYKINKIEENIVSEFYKNYC